jgi:hypothetical protein
MNTPEKHAYLTGHIRNHTRLMKPADRLELMLLLLESIQASITELEGQLKKEKG